MSGLRGVDVKYPKFDKKTIKEYKPAIKELRSYVKQVNEEKSKMKKIFKKDNSLSNKEIKLRNKKEENIKNIKSKADEQKKKVIQIKKLKIDKIYKHYHDLDDKIRYSREKLHNDRIKIADSKYKATLKYKKVNDALKEAIKEGKSYKPPIN